tara:strand:+ start:1415 stop:2341 length:927 start_codon:yes stop_codon:yes gene_type:complete
MGSINSINPSLPDGVELKELLNKLRPLCWDAADILMAYARNEQPPHGFSKSLNIKEYKSGPVSAADLAVNTWLIEGLNTNFPYANWTVLSEETAKENDHKDISHIKEWIWILDPLDGTKDFIQGTGEYAVHLALVKDCRPYLGVVLIPEREELWFGIIGNGTWCENRIGERTSVKFSNRNKLKEMILVSSRSHRNKTLEKLIDRLDIASQKSVGSIGCKIGTILRGETDIYLSLSGETAPKDWDMAAPEALLLAAGGQFTHADLRPLIYSSRDFSQGGCLIATHGKKHSYLCKEIMNELSDIDPCYVV